MRSRRLYEIRERILGALRRLAEELEADVYLFGSYARGDYTLDSDVDVVVVSSRFEGLPPTERAVIARLKLPEDIGFDLILLTPREFEERLGTAFFRDISRYWVRVARRSRGTQA